MMGVILKEIFRGLCVFRKISCIFALPKYTEMQKIVIRNFGPITNAEIELKKTVVLIGEQATGKSTIAKLIYYFKSLKEDLFNKIYNESFNQDFEFDKAKYLVFPLRKKFYEFFGSTHHLRDFEIKYYYNVEGGVCLTLSLDSKKELYVKFSNAFIFGFSERIEGIRNLIPDSTNNNNISAVLAHNQEKLKYADRLSKLLNDKFYCMQDDNLFIIAGRNATVGYSESFEKQFLLSLKNQSEELYKKHQQTIDETLMLDFIDRVISIKDTFRKFGDFDSYAHILDDKKDELRAVANKIYAILKGQYKIDSQGEKLVYGSNDYVYLSNASSGQQEVIRILQDIFLTIAQDSNVVRIVEEPEAHLFPVAQKKVVELLVQMANHNDNNQLIITTHSPYVLTVLNNLLFARRVVDKNGSVEEEVAKIVDKESRMKSSDFSAYVLTNDNGEVASKSIIDQATGMITQNYLDTVSEILANEYNALYTIHAKSFQRQ